jgi:hypothetical protein
MEKKVRKVKMDFKNTSGSSNLLRQYHKDTKNTTRIHKSRRPTWISKT